MGDEAVVDVAVDTGEVIDAVTAVGRTAGGDAAHIGLILYHPGGAEIIVHVQADVVAGNLLAPGLAEGRCTAAVRKNHHIALMAHQEVVPPVAPALVKRALGASQADFDCRILLGGIEARRQKNPGEHLLPVDGSDHAGLGLMSVELAQDMFVLESELQDGVVLHRNEFGGEIHGCETAQQGAVLEHAEGGREIEPEIVGSEAEHHGLVLEHHVEDALDTLGEGGEVDGLAVLGPDGAVGIVFKVRSYVADIVDFGIAALSVRILFGPDDIGGHDAHLVGLVAVALHREPCQMVAVRAPDGVGVITALEGNLGGLAREGAVDIDAGVGREGVLPAFQLLAGIGDVAAVGTPGEVGDIREGAVGQLEEHVLTAEDVPSSGDSAVAEDSHEAVGNVRHPVVPVAVHQIFGRVGLGLVQQRVGVRGNFHGAVYGRNIYQLRRVRRQQIVVNSFDRLLQYFGAFDIIIIV